MPETEIILLFLGIFIATNINLAFIYSVRIAEQRFLSIIHSISLPKLIRNHCLILIFLLNAVFLFCDNMYIICFFMLLNTCIIISVFKH